LFNLLKIKSISARVVVIFFGRINSGNSFERDRNKIYLDSVEGAEDSPLNLKRI